MADDALRRLARAASVGDLEARARLLVEQVRSGALVKERLLLAAQLGDAAARAATAMTGPPMAARARVDYALSHSDGSPIYRGWALDCAERAARDVDESLAVRVRGVLSVARRALKEPISATERTRVLRLSHDLLMETGGRTAPPAIHAVYDAVGTLVDKNGLGSAVDAAALAAGEVQVEVELEWQAQRLAELLLG